MFAVVNQKISLAKSARIIIVAVIIMGSVHTAEAMMIPCTNGKETRGLIL